MHKCLNWIVIFFSLNFFDHKFTQIRFIFLFSFLGENLNENNTTFCIYSHYFLRIVYDISGYLFDCCIYTAKKKVVLNCTYKKRKPTFKRFHIFNQAHFQPNNLLHHLFVVPDLITRCL